MAADPQMRWLRLWTDVLEDPKLLLLAPEDRWFFIGILVLKRSGLLDERDSAEMRDRKVALRLRLDHRERDEVRRRLMEVRLIDKDWQPTGWEKRQFDSDTSVTRTRKWRDKKRHGDGGSDGSVTSPKRHGDALRAETEQRQSRADTPPTPSSPPGPDPSFLPSPASAVCVLLRSMGMVDGHPDHPKLRALLAAGATIGEFEAAARQAKGKRFAYLLAVVEGNRKAAAEVASAVSTPAGPAWGPPEDTPDDIRREIAARESAGLPPDPTLEARLAQ